ncbi:tetratricopeptide repeat-containing diguanylate cyclase [Simiduia aestuariiviva]|uniref:diguanylate cyclase n=1 Tax=Simiduia aestuariiviva TaxID=1510459 RepID=A0A839UPP9_9GAMM|nr:tetratricopeptide repeat-containing diguanylate cyclase [Simiduia aestuariiviva]MBB3167766.1 diguanylate cyclase (GGDEF)-like protein [Simiduia aestuariiviva]
MTPFSAQISRLRRLALGLCVGACLSVHATQAPVDLDQAQQLLSSQPARVIEMLAPAAARSAESDEQHLALLALLTRAYVMQSSLPEAGATASALLTAARRQGNLRYQGVALREQGAIAAVQTRYQDALDLYQQAMATFDKDIHRRERGLTLNATAHAQRALHEYGPALSNARKALALFREVGATGEMAEAFNAMGVILERMGDLEESLAAHLQALEIRRALNLRSGVADSLYNIGEIYRELQDFATAEGYLSESIELDRSLHNRGNEAYGLYKLADIQCALDKFDLARQNGVQALALFQELGAAENVAHVLTNLAKLEYRADDLDAALTYIKQARSEMPLSAAPEIQGKLNLYYARILLRRNALEQAAEVVSENLSMPELLDADSLLTFYRVRAEIYEAQGDMAAALATLKEHNRLRAQRMTEIRNESLAKVRASVEFLQREQQLQLLSRDKTLAVEKSARRTLERNVMLASLVLILCLGMVLLGRFQLRRANLNLKNRLAEQQDQLRVKELALLAAQDQLGRTRDTDTLTGLSNRPFLIANIEQDCAKSMRDYLNWLQQKAPLPVQSDLVFFLVDIDHFKAVNDRLGQQAGDQVLAQMRALLTQVFRETDYLVRWGGEEFLIVSRFSQRENAALLAERLRALVQSTPFEQAEGEGLMLTVSVGFACFPFYTDRPGHYNWTQVVDIADLCLYAAKRSGRNQWVGMTGVEGLEHVDTFQRLFSEPAQVIREGWVNLYTSQDGPEQLVWQYHELGFKPN